MSDNVLVTAGSGTTVAADEVVDGTLGTVKVQFVKLMDGTLDGTSKAAVGSNGLKVDGSGVTQPVSASSLPLPTGAATAAKQPALGTAGTASSDVITVQGIASMTALKVDGSGVTQPVSGTITANAGTNLNTSALALESGGNLASVATNTTGVNNTVGTAASAIPSKLIQIGGSDGTNARAIKTNTSGQLDIRPLTSSDQVTIVPSGTQTVSGTVTVQQSTASSLKVDLSGTAANTTAIKVDGSAVTQPVSGTVSVNTHAVTQSGTWTVGSNSATGSTVPSNAFYQGINPQTSLPTAATAGNLVGATGDKYGRQVILPVTIRDLVGTQTTTISASTSETTIVTAGGVGIYNDLIMLLVSNTSATATRVDFRDTTAGSILFSLYIPAGDARGFSMGGVPIPQTSTNTNWTAQSSASVTDLRIYAVFAKNK